jgi:hypothetical protein
MPNLFPSDVGVTQIRGFVKIVREHGGAMEMAQLAEETEEDLDSMLPIIKSLKMLGLVITKKDLIVLTTDADKAKAGIHQYIAIKLQGIEPFKSIFQILRISQMHTMTTDAIMYSLEGKGIRLDGPGTAGKDNLKRMLLHWCIRSKLLKYNAKEDAWTLVRTD